MFTTVPGLAAGFLLLAFFRADAQQADTSTMPIPAPRDLPGFRVALTGHFGSRFPMGFFGDKWDSYTVAGAAVDLPSVHPDMVVRAEADGGIMPSLTVGARRILVLRQSFSCAWTRRIWKQFSLQPRAGLSNTMAFPGPTLKLSTAPFSTSESELGLIGGVEPCLHIGWLTASLPAMVDIVFSSPHPFVYSTVALRLGGVF